MTADHPSFAHHAMATAFRITVSDAQPTYAAQAAQAAFAELDRIEAEISSYQPGSDISRLNRAAVGEWVRVGQDAFACLTEAQAVARDTGGAFDVTVGALLACWRGAEAPSPEAVADARGRTGWQRLELDPQRFQARKTVAGMQIDLGGIGKGYALDAMAVTLREWGIPRVLLDGGSSTVLALAGPVGGGGWPVGLGWSPQTTHLELEHRALSASGLAVKGAHILDPRTGAPVARWERCWTLAPSAGLADALSTAFMVCSLLEANAYCTRRPDVSAVLLEQVDESRRLRRIGRW